jgi:ABC-type transport system involved in multi-copper enzyme maturation permease subunit
MFAKLLKFELKLHTRQVGFWVTCLVLSLFGVLASSTDFIQISLEGSSRIKNNGAIPLALNIGFLSVLSIFFAAVFVVTGVMRDDTHKSLEIIHATPLKTSTLLITRMIGVWITTSLCVIAGVIGLMAGQFMPWADQETFQALNIVHYIQPVLFFVLINSLMVSGIYTVVAAVTRNRALVYVSAVAFLMILIGSGIIAGENPPKWVEAMIDPFGLGALAAETRYWPPVEQNNNMMPIMGWIGINRLFYALAGAAMFALAFAMSTRGIAVRKIKDKGKEAAPLDIKPLTPITPQLGRVHNFSTFLKRLKFEYIRTVKTVPFVILVGLALVLFGVGVWAQLFMNVSPTLPTSRVFTQLALSSLGLPMVIIMVFFGSDIMWRDRTAKIHELLDASPVKNISLLLAKWGALALVLLTIVVLGLIVAAAVQLIAGGGKIPAVPMTYLSIGVFSFFIGFFFQGMLVMFLQNFMPNRVIGMIGAAAILFGMVFFLGNLPFYHPLMSYGTPSAGAYSEMAGFSNPGSFMWEFAYWFAMVVILGVATMWLWRRGLQIGLKSRMKHARANMSRPSLALGGAALAAFIGTGYMGLQSYKADEFENRDAREKRQVAYEKLVTDYDELALPKIRAVTADMQFYPSRRRAELTGTYVIENASNAPMDRVFINSPVALDDILEFSIERAQRNIDDELSVALTDYEIMDYRFTPPLSPGERRNISFKTQINPPTLTSGSAIAKNGTFINNFSMMPSFGIPKGFYLTNPDKRRKFGLPKRDKLPQRWSAEARARNFITGFADYVDFEATVCTEAGQIPIAPGKQIGEYNDGDRACRDFKAINPILNFFSFLTAEYAVKTDVWDNPNGEDVALEIYYHPSHDFNVDLMLEAMKKSFDSYTEIFSPYQYAQLRIMEFPYRSFAQAFAGTVPFSENIGFVQDPGKSDDDKRIDFASYVTMHEIGHQWFAHQLVAGHAKGGNVLSEGLTENAAMIAYEATFGHARARRLHEERSTRNYLTGRVIGRSSEEPLALAENNQQFLVYNKASWVFWGLRHYAGTQAVQTAIRSFLEEHGTSGPPYPTTLELVSQLKETLGPDYHQLIKDYFDRITFWELKIEDDVDITAAGDKFQLSLPIKIDKKYAAKKDGKETSVSEIPGASLNEWVQVGFYTEDPKETLGENPFFIKTVKITEAETTLDFTLDQRPTHIMLDPKRLLIERNLTDNVKDVTQKIAANE